MHRSPIQPTMYGDFAKINTGTPTNIRIIRTLHQKMRIRLYMFQLARNAGCFTNNWTGFSSPKLSFDLSFDNELSQFRSFSQGRGSKNWSVRKLQSKLKMVEKQWEVCLSSAGSHFVSICRTQERSFYDTSNGISRLLSQPVLPDHPGKRAILACC